MGSVPSNFWEWADALKADERFGLMCICVGALVTIAVVVCGTLSGIHRTRAENALKRELLDRGLNADEIATIVNKLSENAAGRVGNAARRRSGGSHA